MASQHVERGRRIPYTKIFELANPIKTVGFMPNEQTIIMITKSGTSGFYHVIEDCPGPDCKYQFLDKYQIAHLFNIEIENYFK